MPIAPSRQGKRYFSAAEQAADQSRYLDEWDGHNAAAGPAAPRAPAGPRSIDLDKWRRKAVGNREQGTGSLGRAPFLNAPNSQPGRAGPAGGYGAPPPPPQPRMPGAAPPLSRYHQPGSVGSERAQGAIDSLGNPIKLAGSKQVKLRGAPGRVGEYSGLADAPERVGGYSPMGDAPAWGGVGPMPGRGGADNLIARAGAGTNLADRGRENLGGPRGDNAWENNSLGQMYEGREIRKEVFNEAQAGQMAQQRAAPTIRAVNDANEQAARGASRGGSFDPSRAAAGGARAMIAGAGAIGESTRDAQLDAAAANAQQEQAASANARENFNADIGARLGMGRLGMERRGLDQTRDIAGYQGQIEQRGQDVTGDIAEGRINADLLQSALGAETDLRGQDVDYTLESGRQGLTERGQTLGHMEEGGRQGLAARGQDVNQRGQEMDYAAEGGRQNLAARGQDVTQRGQTMDYNVSGANLQVQQRAQDMERQYREAGLNAEQARAKVQAELGLRDQDIDQALGLGRLGLDARRQEADYNTTTRGQDIEATLGMGRLGQDAYRTESDNANQQAERENRLSMLDRQLADNSLDRQTRAELEREKMQLEQEMQSERLTQQGGQFGQTFGEDRRQFDETMDFNREGRDMNLAASGRFDPTPQYAGMLNPFGSAFGGPAFVPPDYQQQMARRRAGRN